MREQQRGALIRVPHAWAPRARRTFRRAHAAAATARTADGEHVLERRAECRAIVGSDAPEAAVIHSHDAQRVRLKTGERLEAIVHVRLTTVAVWVSGEVTIDGETVFRRIWDANTPA